MISQILCPVDFSDESMRAFRYADAFANKLQANIVLLHAFGMPNSYDRVGQWTPADPEIMPRLAAIESEHDVPLTCLTHAGTAGEVICWAAEDQNCDLIIMGTHGRSGVSRAIFGSTAEYALRHARCPVLTIRRQPQNLAPLREPQVVPPPPPRLM